MRFSERCGVSRAEKQFRRPRHARDVKVVACRHRPSVYPDHGENHPQASRSAQSSSISACKGSRSQQSRSRRLSKKAAPKARELKSAEGRSPGLPAEVHEAFSRFRKANPEPKRRARTSQSLSHCWLPSCYRRRPPMPVSTSATRALFEVADTPWKDARSRRGHGCAITIKTIGLYRTKAKNVIALSARLISRIRRRGAAHPGRARDRCPAQAARPPMSCSTWRSASTPWQWTRMSFGSATAPRMAPGKTPLEVELGTGKGSSRPNSCCTPITG